MPSLSRQAFAFFDIFCFVDEYGGNIKRQFRFAALAASTPILESSIAIQFLGDSLLSWIAKLYASGKGLCLFTSSYVIISEKYFKLCN